MYFSSIFHSAHLGPCSFPSNFHFYSLCPCFHIYPSQYSSDFLVPHPQFRLYFIQLPICFTFILAIFLSISHPWAFPSLFDDDFFFFMLATDPVLLVCLLQGNCYFPLLQMKTDDLCSFEKWMAWSLLHVFIEHGSVAYVQFKSRKHDHKLNQLSSWNSSATPTVELTLFCLKNRTISRPTSIPHNQHKRKWETS